MAGTLSYGINMLSVLAVAALVAAIWAAVDIVSSPRTSLLDKLLWCVAVVLVPVVGAFVWFAMRASLSTRES